MSRDRSVSLPDVPSYRRAHEQDVGRELRRISDEFNSSFTPVRRVSNVHYLNLSRNTYIRIIYGSKQEYDLYGRIIEFISTNIFICILRLILDLESAAISDWLNHFFFWPVRNYVALQFRRVME